MASFQGVTTERSFTSMIPAISKRQRENEAVMNIPFTSLSMNDNALDNEFRAFFDSWKKSGRQDGVDANLTHTFQTRFDNPDLRVRLGTIAIGLASRAPSYINTRLFPLFITNDLRFQSSMIRFGNDYPTAVPALGTSRSFAYTMTTTVSTSKRQGMHFTMEQDQFNTDMGRYEFQVKMQYMLKCMKEAYADYAWAAMMREPNMKIAYSMQDKLNDDRKFFDALDNEVESFAEAYKSEYGIYSAVQRYRQILQARAEIDMPVVMIMPDDKKTLILDPSINTYEKLGPDGVAKIIGDGVITSISTVPVYPAIVHPEMPSVLNTDVRVGQFHVFINRHEHMIGDDKLFNYAKFMVDTMYDVERNEHVKLDFQVMNENDGRWSSVGTESADTISKVHLIDTASYKKITSNGSQDANESDLFAAKSEGEYKLDDAVYGATANGMRCTIGNLKQYLSPKFVEGINKWYDDTVAQAKAIADTTAIPSKINDVLKKLLATQPKYDTVNAVKGAKTMAALKTALEACVPDLWVLTMELVSMCVAWRVPPPWGFLVLRPFIGHSMQTAVFCMENAGQTNVSEIVVNFGPDPVNGNYYFGCTSFAGVHVWDPRRILHANNFFYNGLLGGCTVEPIAPQDADNLKKNNFKLPGKVNLDRPSLYVCSIPHDTLSKNRMPHMRFLDIKGKFLIESARKEVKVHWPGCAFYKEKYGFGKIDDRAAMAAQQATPIARICYQAHARVMNHAGTGMEDILGQGHNGPIEDTGCRIVRKDGKARIPKPR